MKPYFVGVLLAVFGSAQADTYRWVDQSGKVHYGDMPAVEAVQVEKKKFDKAPDDANLPYATRRALQYFPVTLYLADNCKEICQQARDFLNKRGIPFTEINLVMQEEIDNFTKESGSDQSPTLAVGKTYLKGFGAKQWGVELDIAGYPKTAPYRPETTAKPSSDKSKNILEKP